MLCLRFTQSVLDEIVDGMSMNFAGVSQLTKHSMTWSDSRVVPPAGAPALALPAQEFAVPPFTKKKNKDLFLVSCCSTT